MLRPIQPCIDYILNQEYIATVLCINRDKPKLQCQGKCQLKKAFEKQQNDDSPKSSTRLALELYPIGFVNFVAIPKNNLVELSQKHEFSYNNLYHFIFSKRTFHPPNSLV